MNGIEKAIEEFESGNFVLVHDSSDRENETDMVLAAEKAKPKHIAKMRQDGGGLICVAVHPQAADNLSIPYISEIYESASSKYEILNKAKADDIPYGERSSFSIAVNHRNTFTGITDSDRALTISELGKMSSRAFNGASAEEFGENFRTPGHVPILRAAEGLLENRQGHTEYSIALAEMADVSPAAVVCEMMDSETKKALSIDDARRYAEREDLIHLSGDEIREAYMEWKDSGEGREWRVSG